MAIFTPFSIRKVNALRRKAQRATSMDMDDPQQGWAKSDVDPLEIVSIFSPLLVKEGYVLRAYQFRSGLDGNSVLWAMPEGTEFPEPADCPHLDDFLGCPKPPAALDNYMAVIEGDGTPWSYLCASLLGRELSAFGAVGHGCSWGSHTILGEDPFESDHPPGERMSEAGFDRPEEWTWQEERPTEWRPRVCVDGDTVVSCFYSYSRMGLEAIYQHTDTCQAGSYVATVDEVTIATGIGMCLY